MQRLVERAVGYIVARGFGGAVPAARLFKGDPEQDRGEARGQYEGPSDRNGERPVEIVEAERRAAQTSSAAAAMAATAIPVI